MSTQLRPLSSLNLLQVAIFIHPPTHTTSSPHFPLAFPVPSPFGAQAPFDGDNIYDDIVAGKYEFPTDVNVSDDAKVRLGCDWPIFSQAAHTQKQMQRILKYQRER